MAADGTAEIERIKTLVRERIRRVPPGVVNGGTEQIKAYKAVVKEASAMLDGKRTTLLKAQSVFGKLNAFT